MSNLSRMIREAAADPSPVLKLVLIGGLTLALLIPLWMIRSLVSERAARRREAESGIVNQWGGEQTVAGPLLVVPYLSRTKDERGRVEETVVRAIFLPQTLRVSGRVEPERRRRGIYEVTLYTADLALEGAFVRPDFSRWRVAPTDVLWDEAELIVEIAGLHGLRERVQLRWGDRSVDFAAGAGETGLLPGAIRAPLPRGLQPREPGREYVFSLRLPLQGGQSLGFLPLGDETTVRLSSPWTAPGFSGAFLPRARSLGYAGFDAEWYVLSLNRSYPQAWRPGEIEESPLRASRFGVDLIVPVDTYLKTERSIKYGLLFILLPSLVFFLFELFARRRVHPLQYLLVGLADCLYFLLLLSLGEHLPFGWAYLLSALTTVALVASYAAAVLGGWRRGIAILPLLGLSYLFLYAALQSEDYALLIGSLGIFGVLTAVMIVTRRVDWYRPGGPAGGQGPVSA